MAIETQIINSTGRTLISINLPDETGLVIATGVLAIVTAVLVGVTWKLAKESGLMRRNQERPNFALEPTMYGMGGDFQRLALTNEGQTATELRIDASWGEQTQEKIKLYCISLSKSSMTYLDQIPIGDIKKNNKKILVNITCKDTSGKKFDSRLEIDFLAITKDGRDVAFQYDSEQSVTNSLSNISREISSIQRALSQLASSLSRIR